MRIAIYEKYGPPDVLQIVDREKPIPKKDEVLVKVYASSINPIDWKIRKGLLKVLLNKKFPKTLGADFAGVVEETGPDQKARKKGDHVFGMVEYMKGKAYAEYLTARPEEVALKPSNLDFDQSAAIPLTALTALQAFRNLTGIEKGQKILITGSAGGVGSFAVQIAKAFGAEVTAVCSTEKTEISRELGADHIVDYKQQDIMGIATRFDIFFDAVAKYPFPKVRKLIRKKGHYITTLPSPANYIRSMLGTLTGGKKLHTTSVKPNADDLALLKELAESGKLKPIIDSKYELGEVAEAHKKSETGKVTGKIVLTVS